MILLSFEFNMYFASSFIVYIIILEWVDKWKDVQKIFKTGSFLSLVVYSSIYPWDFSK